MLMVGLVLGRARRNVMHVDVYRCVVEKVLRDVKSAAWVSAVVNAVIRSASSGYRSK